MSATWELYDMFQAFLQAPAYHLAFEGILLMLVLWLFFKKSYKLQQTELTEKEKEQLIAEWVPEPLVPETDPDHYSLNPKTVTGKVGKYVSVDGKECLNLATHNYLSLVDHPDLEKAATDCLDKYGVGSCGPRGFYGTVDIHLELEDKLSKFMGVEEAVLYSYGFSTVSSAIPAYAKHGDIIFCDEGVSLAIQKGLLASRSKICYFKHNDAKDLEKLLLEQARIDEEKPSKAKVIRRFLVVEGLYMNYGDICPLPEMMVLKKKFKVRILVDETCSFGVLGDTGRGITEHYNIDIHDIDLITATLESAIPAFGGFCCGTSFIVDHQRLSGLGYCFSASLPPLQAGVAIAALEILESDTLRVSQLRGVCKYLHGKLQSLSSLTVHSCKISPVQHLYLTNELPRKEATKKLDDIVEYALQEGIALTVSRYIEEEEHLLPPPSIRVVASAELTEQNIDRAVSVLQKASESLLVS